MAQGISGDNDLTLLTPREVADLLNLQPGTLATWRSKGVGPPYANLGGRRVRYRLGDVERWIADQVQSGQGPTEMS